ncbi:MAG: hypothetical protein HY697_04830 [Deltaproteobacteria bacterium]|nr:hypothetical protein [Deltaproteobacteria bacterium]
MAPPIPRGWLALFGLLAAAGALTFWFGISGTQAGRAWQAFLFNYLFWTGLSFGSVLFVAILNMAEAFWGRPLKRLAEGLGAFLPVSYLLFWALYAGREAIFPWLHHPVPEKAAWLNVPFLFARNGAALFVLTAVAVALIYLSVRSDQALAARLGHIPSSPSLATLSGERYWRGQQVLSPIFAILYAFILSLLAIDLIMSLDPHWISTLFGGYYFMSSFYCALAALYLLTMISWGRLGMKEYLRPRHLHDLGKLVFAFCIFTGYLFFVQLLTIWYGNLPEETAFLILRVKTQPWQTVAWVILFMIFAIPFATLLSRKVKIKPWPAMILTLVILAGMWLERFMLVVPSIWKGPELPLGLMEILIAAGFFGALALCLAVFLRRVPLLPISDPLFRRSAAEKEERLEP